jgi:hypothetical protein
LGAAHPDRLGAAHAEPDRLGAVIPELDRLGAAHPEPDRLGAVTPEPDRLGGASPWAESGLLGQADVLSGQADVLSGQADALGGQGDATSDIHPLRFPVPEEIGGERPPDSLSPVVPPPERRPKVALAAAATVAVVSVLAVGTYLVVSNGRGSSPSAGGSPSATLAETTAESPIPTDSTTAPEPSPSETSTGIVTILPTVVDSRATDVAAMLNTYFSAINSQDYQTAASVFDPSGPINPNSPAEVAAMAKGLATTTDSEVVLRQVADATDGTVTAVVTFHSSQAPGYGPKGHEQETCTQWSIIYSLRQTATGYLILRTKGTPSRC